jgi:hypothetical protein
VAPPLAKSIVSAARRRQDNVSTLWVSPEHGGFMNRKKLFVALGVALMVALGVYRRIRHEALPSETEMATIMKEAAGTAPISDRDTAIRKAIRESFKYLLEENRSYESEVNQRFRTKYMANLLHPYSFAVDAYRQGAMTELRSLKDLDQAHMAAVQRFPDVAQSNLIAAGVSGADAKAFAAGTRGGDGGGIDGFSHATDLELKWIDSLLELYQFAEDNRTHIGMHTTAELTFDDENVRAQFMALANKVDDLSEQSTKAAAVLEGRQQRHSQRMSFTTRDSGQP